ncbi:MAG: hypothetical protein BWX70_00295 [Verrucomicrobia bacterium ADurb.Bin070]|nr:MAG: hypothetical protein BWX70_00295 [Verrucomicrobia bacterium ADurb.Bin070]
MVGQRSLIAQTVLLGVFAPLRENNSAVSSRWNDRSAHGPFVFKNKAVVRCMS